MNRATLIGNLTRDPDLRMTNGGVSVCTFSIAVQRRFANQQGERPADFFNIVCWRGLADNCGKYLHKGCLLYTSSEQGPTNSFYTPPYGSVIIYTLSCANSKACCLLGSGSYFSAVMGTS